MAKKIEWVEIEINGQVMEVMPHTLSDYMKFGARQTRRTVVKIPEELQSKLVIMPNDKLKTLLQIPKEPAPEMTVMKVEPAKPDLLQKMETLEKTPSRRKSPVKSKSKR